MMNRFTRLLKPKDPHLAGAQFDAYQDGALTEAGAAAYRQHLASCPQCREAANEHSAIAQQLRNEASPKSFLSPAAAARIRQNMSSRMRRAMIMNNMKAYVAGTAVIAVLALIVGLFAWQLRSPETPDTVEPAILNVTPEATEPAVTPEATVAPEALAEQLVAAVAARDAAAVEQLLEAGADPNTPDASGDPLLRLVVLDGSTDIIEPLIAYGADVNALDSRGDALLPQAARAGQLEPVRLLLNNGADVMGTMRTRIGGAVTEDGTSLYHAAYFGHAEIVRLLIDHGADVNQGETWVGETPLHTAAWQNRPEVARILLEHGADPNATSEFLRGGDTPLHYAAGAGSPDIIPVLLQGGANPDAQTATGWTPLIRAIRRLESDTLVQVLVALLEGGANPDVQDENGNTALHHAVQVRQVETVQLLIEFGADVNLQNNAGRTALDLVVDDEIADILRESGANQ
jgi:ankyrin repeat protein